MRTSHWPPRERANSHDPTAATRLPRWSGPVGEGANRPVCNDRTLVQCRAARRRLGTAGGAGGGGGGCVAEQLELSRLESQSGHDAPVPMPRLPVAGYVTVAP